jgi:hypothetical protein
MRSITAAMSEPVTVLSSLPAPADLAGGWVQLADDLPSGCDADVSAGGTLHWAPRHHAGLRDRMAAIAAWVAARRPALVVVDVSVEVAVLVRAMGVPVVVAAMRGDRGDRAHRSAYDLADALLAPWPADLPEPWPQAWLDKAWHVGGLSRHDRRPGKAAPGRSRVLVLWGRGGTDVTAAHVEAAAAATPGWAWESCGLAGGPWVDDPWPLLQEADVVVTHAGQNAVAEVAAARRPAVLVPQARPHGEQLATGRAIAGARLAVVEAAWPAPERWGAVLDEASALDPGGWARWSDGGGAARAAALLDEAAACARR